MLVTAGDTVLLGRQPLSSGGAGPWTLPASWIDVEETAEAAAARAAQETCRVAAKVTGIVGRPHSSSDTETVSVSFRGELRDPGILPASSAHLGWFTAERIPWAETRNRPSGAARRPSTPGVHNARVDSMTDRVPTREELCLPTLRVLQQRGGSASIREISEDMVALLELRDVVREVPHGNGPQSEFDYQAAWARTYLKRMNAATNSSRGVWSMTDYGRDLTAEADTGEADVQGRILEHIRSYRRSLLARRAKNAAAADSLDSTDDDGDTEWTEELLGALREMAPDAFERLCQRLLRESGFTKVEVTGRTGDGGIDGIGVLRVNLISFQIVFQCKRYAGVVGSGAIRDFRGSMVGRADKGLFMTTGRFSPSAEQEAVRDGAPAIDLIDGNELCGLLKGLDLGVRTETVERVTVEASFFESI